MAYAVIRINHQQFQLQPGDSITLNGTIGAVDKNISLGEILLLKDNTTEVGTPVISGDVKFKVTAHQKSPKITVKTFKAKSRYRRTKGHRQPQTVLELVQAGPLTAGKKPAPAKKTSSKPKKTPAKKSSATSKTTTK